MSDALRTSIENGVVEALSRLKDDFEHGYLKTLEVYHGPTAPSREDENFQRVAQGALPAVLVGTGDGNYERLTMGRTADLVVDLNILVAGSNLRSGEARQQGDGQLSRDPGIFKIIENIRDRLYQFPLPGAAGFCRARPVAETRVLAAPDRTIWLVTYTLRTDVREEAIDAEDGDYTSIHNELGFSQVEEPGAPVNVAEFDNLLL